MEATKTYMNWELGIESMIVQTEAGDFAVSLTDTCTAQTLESVKIFPPTMKREAYRYARKIANVELQEMRRAVAEILIAATA